MQTRGRGTAAGRRRSCPAAARRPKCMRPRLCGSPGPACSRTSQPMARRGETVARCAAADGATERPGVGPRG
uniref:Uncharacterized protein n=1 Tax=Setaria italica TaxID=4555 RepID=K3XNZ9_SETIT